MSDPNQDVSYNEEGEMISPVTTSPIDPNTRDKDDGNSDNATDYSEMIAPSKSNGL